MGRVLLVRTSHLGDCVRALPLARALLEQRPNVEVGWAIQPEYAALLEGFEAHGRGLRAIPIPRREGAGGTWRGLRQVRAFAPDWVVDVQGNAKSALVTAAARAAVRLGPEARHCREALPGRFALNRRAPSPPDAGPHACDRVAELAGALDLDLAGVARGPELREAELHRARERVAQRFAEAPPRLAYVADSGDARSWPVERWVALVERCAERGLPVALHGGPQEIELMEQLARAVSGSRAVHVQTEPLPLREFAALARACAERGGRLLGSDTGPTHLAASTGLPVALLSGPTDPRRTGVWPDPGREPHCPHRIVGYDPPWLPGESHVEPDWEWPGPPAADIGVEQALAAWLDD
jgi:ADP-heptose:LPS heptosyltransferase